MGLELLIEMITTCCQKHLQTGLAGASKCFASKCDSVEYYVRIINEVWAYEAFRSLRQRHLNDGVIPDGMELAMTLDSYATDPNYIPLVRSVIKNNIRGVYDL